MRNTRSGCGIVMVTRPSAEQTPAIARGDPLGFAGKVCVDAASSIHVAQRDAALRVERIGSRLVAELGLSLAVRDDDGDDGALHAGQQDRRAALDAHQGDAGLVLLGVVANEARPVRGARHDLVEVREHLAAVAQAQRERVGPGEERRELIARAAD